MWSKPCNVNTAWKSQYEQKMLLDTHSTIFDAL